MTQKDIKIFGKTATIHMRNEGDLAIANELFLDHQYQYCDEIIRQADHCILDIGGHLGFFSLYASLLNNKVPIYTFEPHEGNYELLKTNMKENRVKNVTPRRLAVSNKAGEAELLISAEDLNHSLNRAIEPTGEIQKVQTTTLERIFEKNRIERCDLLKMDCEGAEFDIIYGAPVDLFKKIDHIFLEYHDWIQGADSRKLQQYLEKSGYKVQRIQNSKMKELGFLWCKR